MRRTLNVPAASLEGYLFPATYAFADGTTAREAVNAMLERFESVWKPEWDARVKAMAISRHDAITMASIIEKEARKPEERALISAVYWNRVKKGMLLQADPTVQYALPQHVDRVFYKDLEVESQYNTYKYVGLPPGPIASPGEASIAAALAPADQFAAVELFRGTMATHSVVAYRDDHPGGTPQPDFSGDAWRHYVPIRLPDTVCVQERLPPGAAAVLINRTHPYRDLVLAIDEAEKRLLDAVDGSRSIAAIVGKQGAMPSSPALPDLARSFFERLWWWDQMVFDLSGAQPRP